MEIQPKLTAKQKAFCHEYLIDKNGSKAALIAAYSKTTAHQIAAENLRKPYVKAYLDELVSRQTERTKITGDKVISSYSISLLRKAFRLSLDSHKLNRITISS